MNFKNYNRTPIISTPGCCRFEISGWPLGTSHTNFTIWKRSFKSVGTKSMTVVVLELIYNILPFRKIHRLIVRHWCSTVSELVVTRNNGQKHSKLWGWTRNLRGFDKERKEEPVKEFDKLVNWNDSIVLIHLASHAFNITTWKILLMKTVIKLCIICIPQVLQWSCPYFLQ